MALPQVGLRDISSVNCSPFKISFAFNKRSLHQDARCSFSSGGAPDDANDSNEQRSDHEGDQGREQEGEHQECLHVPREQQNLNLRN